MEVISLPLGPLASNMFIVRNDGDFFIVDPSVPVDVCTSRVTDFDIARVKAVFITHAHFDHVFCVTEWKSVCQCPFYLRTEERRLLNDGELNCSYMVGCDRSFGVDTVDVSEIPGSFGSLKVSTIHTPGHTSGSVCYCFDDGNGLTVFTGDTVFAGSVGRTDFPTGNISEMMESVDVIKKLPPDTPLYPGHGPSTTVAEECESNPYFF